MRESRLRVIDRDRVIEKDAEDVADDDEVDVDDVDHDINEGDIDVVNKRMRKMLIMLVTIMLRLVSMGLLLPFLCQDFLLTWQAT